MHIPSYDPSTFLPWAQFNGISFHYLTTIRHLSESKGYGVVTVKDIGSEAADHANAKAESSQEGNGGEGWEPTVLMTVPKDLVLSLGLVEEHAKVDRWLREVLEAIGEWGKTPRGAILLFLLLQHTHLVTSMTTSSPTIGVSHPLTQYVASLLPIRVPLPTFYSSAEREILYGTSLEDALAQKISSLEREFDNLRSSTENIEWCRRIWWDPVDFGPSVTGREGLRFHDWLHIDSLYRSRALDLPGTGHAMVPCVDMANHASLDQTSALYETDPTTGDALLQFIDRNEDGSKRVIKAGDEITISYGDEKGACEMIYSYGFLEEGMDGARMMFLDLDMMEDDPLAVAKKMVCGEAPGVRLFKKKGKQQSGKSKAEDDVHRKRAQSEKQSDPNLPKDDAADRAPAADDKLDEDEETISWESPYLFWILLNQEDGLDFTVIKPPIPDSSSPSSSSPSPPPQPTLQLLYSSYPITPSSLPSLLPTHPHYPIFLLRAHTLLLQRVESQLAKLRASDVPFSECMPPSSSSFSSGPQGEEEEERTTTPISSRTYTTIAHLRTLERAFLEDAQGMCRRQIERGMNEPVVREYLGLDDDDDDKGDGKEGEEGEEEDFS